VLTKEEYEATKRALEIRKMQRKEAPAALDSYTGFAVSKLAGLVLVVCGGLGIISPSLMHIPHPAYKFGVGLALLTGKSIVSLLAKALET
jgi:hypothetical protein